MKLNEIMHWELSTLPAKLELMSLRAYSLSLELQPETSVFSREVSAGLGWLPGTLQGDRKEGGGHGHSKLVTYPLGASFCDSFLPPPLWWPQEVTVATSPFWHGPNHFLLISPSKQTGHHFLKPSVGSTGGKPNCVSFDQMVPS